MLLNSSFTLEKKINSNPRCTLTNNNNNNNNNKKKGQERTRKDKKVGVL